MAAELKTFLRRWHTTSFPPRFIHPAHDIAPCKSRASELNPLGGNLEILLDIRSTTFQNIFTRQERVNVSFAILS